MIERCGDRQRKCDGLGKWPLHIFVESLPLMLQVALLLLACGLCLHMWSINTSVAYILIVLTGSGVLFYVAVVIAGMSSYACPFQTPASTALRSLWKMFRQGTITSTAHFGKTISRIHRIWNRIIHPLLLHQYSPQIPLEDVRVQEPDQLLKLDDLVAILRTNANDVRCVSWILRNITDPESLDAAVRLAGMVRWFEDGTDVLPPHAYDTIISTFHACFDIDGNVYPGSRDRAYYSGRAILWIRTLATCKSEAFARRFPLVDTRQMHSASDHDLAHLLEINMWSLAEDRIEPLLDTYPGHTSSHLRWISNVLLHHSWANRTTLVFEWFRQVREGGKMTIPLDVILNRILTWCICLGSSVEEDMLKVQDKSCDIFCFCIPSCSHCFSPVTA